MLLFRTGQKVGAVAPRIVVDGVHPALVALQGEVGDGRAQPPDLHSSAKPKISNKKKKKYEARRGDGWRRARCAVCVSWIAFSDRYQGIPLCLEL